MRQLLIPATVTLNTMTSNTVTSSTAALSTSTPYTRPALSTVSWDEPGQPGRSGHARSLRPRSVVRVLDQWRYAGRWWEDEVSRDYYLVELADGVRLELFQEGDAWWLSKMSD